MKSNALYFGLLVLVVSGAAAVRLVALNADPPPSMTYAFVSDEAWWAHNARNQVLFGKWILDDFNQGIFAAPLHTAMVWLSFTLGGVSLEQTRMVSALCGLTTIALLGWMLTRELGRWSGLAGMLVLGFDYFTVSYDRVGFVEPLPTALMTLSATLLLARKYRVFSLTLAGIVAVLAYFAKANAVFFEPVPVLFLLTSRLLAHKSEDPHRAPLAREVAAYVLGALCCFALWFVFFIRPHWAQYHHEVGRLRDEARLNGLHGLFNFFKFALADQGGIASNSMFLTQALLPLGLFCLWGIHTGSFLARHGFRHTISRMTQLERLAVIWILMILPYFVISVNDWDRRYHIFLVPMTILGVHLLGSRRWEPFHFKFNRGPGLSKPSILISSTLVMLPIFLYLRAPIIPLIHAGTSSLRIGAQPGLSTGAAAALATLSLGVLVLLTFPIVFRILPSMTVRVGIIAWLMVAALLPAQLWSIGTAASRSSYTMQEVTARFRSLLGPDVRVVDGSAFVLGTPGRNLIMLDRQWAGYVFYGKALIPSFRPTHLAVAGQTAEADFAAYADDRLSGWGSYLPGTLHIFEFCPRESGGKRFAVTLGEIRPAQGK